MKDIRVLFALSNGLGSCTDGHKWTTWSTQYFQPVQSAKPLTRQPKSLLPHCNPLNSLGASFNMWLLTLWVLLSMGPVTADLQLIWLITSVSGLRWHSLLQQLQTIMAFLSTIFTREGNLCTITTDNGPQFTSSAFADFLRERGIKHIRTSVYHHQANGAVEHFNRVLKDSIPVALSAQLPWKPAVTTMLHSYRTTAHATTGESPFRLLRERPIRTKLDVLEPSKDSGKYDHVIAKVASQQAKSQRHTDTKRGARSPKFAVCDKVHIRKPFNVGKGEPRFSAPISVQQQQTFILSSSRHSFSATENAWMQYNCLSVQRGLKCHCKLTLILTY